MESKSICWEEKLQMRDRILPRVDTAENWNTRMLVYFTLKP